MSGFGSGAKTLFCLCGLLGGSLWAQQQQQQNVPDAPKPKPQAEQSQFPDDAPPVPKNEHASGTPAAGTLLLPETQAARLYQARLRYPESPCLSQGLSPAETISTKSALR